MSEELPEITRIKPEVFTEEVSAIFCSGSCEESIIGLLIAELKDNMQGNLVLQNGNEELFTEIMVAAVEINNQVITVLLANPIANRDFMLVEQLGHKIKKAVVEIKDAYSDKAKRQARLAKKLQAKANGTPVGIYGIQNSEFTDLGLRGVRRLEYNDIRGLIDGKRANR